MDDDLARRVGRLEEIEAVRVLKARYADVCDTGYDPARIRPLFTEDAVWDGGPRFGRHEGIDAICRFFADVSSQITWALHYLMAPVIELSDDGRTATGSWYLLEPCTMVVDGEPRATVLMGRYADRYRKGEAGWQISELVLDCQVLTPLDEGWVRTPFLES